MDSSQRPTGSGRPAQSSPGFQDGEPGGRSAHPVDEHFQAAFRAATDFVSAWVAIVDGGGTIRACSAGVSGIVGFEPEQFLGQSFLSGVLVEDRERLKAELAAAVEDGRRERHLIHGRTHQDGTSVQLNTVVANHLDRSEVRGLVITCTPMVRPDDLAGRATLLDLAERVVPGQTATYGFISVDLIDFQRIAAGLGHRRSGVLWERIGQRIRRHLSDKDHVAQTGSHELGIFVGEALDRQALQASAERLRKIFHTPFDVDGQTVHVLVSLGCATPSRRSMDKADVLAEAEAAAMRAGTRRGAPAEVFATGMRTEARRRLQLADALPLALERREFSLVYQPIVRLSDGRVDGFEALLRWKHDRFGNVGPAEFVALAEDLQRIKEIDRWVLRRVCRDFAGRSEPPVHVSVNISAQHLDDASLVDSVQAVLQSVHAPGLQLRIEVTETCLVKDPDASRETLQRIRDMGVKVAMDDFATGHATINQLATLPVDVVKIDRSYVSRMTFDKQIRGLIHSIIFMAKELDMGVVAEGVETAEEFGMLRAMGCEFGQGYLFSRPVPLSAALGMNARVVI